MDKTIEVLVVAMVALVTGLIILYLVQGQTGPFGDFLDDQQQSAKCDNLRTQYKNCLINQKQFNDQSSGKCGLPASRNCNSG